MGILESKIALATISSLNAHKSSIEPPPLPTIIVSACPHLFTDSIALAMLGAASSPCTRTGITTILTLGFLLPETFIISLTAAPVGDVITAIHLG